jgi:hypothetical protein
VKLLARIMESEVGCICVAVALVFAPIGAARALGDAGVPVAGTEPQGMLR